MTQNEIYCSAGEPTKFTSGLVQNLWKKVLPLSVWEIIRQVSGLVSQMNRTSAEITPPPPPDTDGPPRASRTAQVRRAVGALDHERLISVRGGRDDDVRQRDAVGGAEAADVATDGEERWPAAGVGEERRGLLPTSASAPAACWRRASKAGSKD